MDHNSGTQVVNQDIPLHKRVFSEARRVAGILMLLSVGLAAGLVLRELTWPALGEHPLLRLAVTVLLLAALVMLSLLCAYEKRKLIQAARGTAMMVFLLAIGLSVVYVSSFVSHEVQMLILRGLSLVFFAAIPGWLYLQFMWGERSTIWTEYVSNLFRLHVDEYPCLPEPPCTRVLTRTGLRREMTPRGVCRTGRLQVRTYSRRNSRPSSGRWPVTHMLLPGFSTSGPSCP